MAAAPRCARCATRAPILLDHLVRRLRTATRRLPVRWHPAKQHREPAKILLLADLHPGAAAADLQERRLVQAYREEPAHGEQNSASCASACASGAPRATASLPVAQGAFYGEAGEVIEQDIVQEEPAFWFLALARCQEWVDALENATAGADKCWLAAGNVPNGVFMAYELRLYNPECAGGPTCSYWTKELGRRARLYEMHLFVLMLGRCSSRRS